MDWFERIRAKGRESFHGIEILIHESLQHGYVSRWPLLYKSWSISNTYPGFLSATDSLVHFPKQKFVNYMEVLGCGAASPSNYPAGRSLPIPISGFVGQWHISKMSSVNISMWLVLGGRPDGLLAAELPTAAGRLSVGGPRRWRLLSALWPPRSGNLLLVVAAGAQCCRPRRRCASTLLLPRSTGTGLPELATGRSRRVHRLPMCGT